MYKQVKVTDIKIGDIIVGEQYKLQCSKRDSSGFNGLQWQTYDTELEVLRIKVLESGKIRLTVSNPAHIMTKTYKPNQILSIK